MEDEIKVIDIEIEKEAVPIPKEPEPPKERINQIDKYDIIKKAQEEVKRNKLEDWLGGRKIVDPEDYEELKRKASLFNAVKYILVLISIVAIIILMIWAIQVYKDKEIYQNTFINNTNNLPETNVQAPINLQVNNTNNPTLQMNVTINIDKILVNSS